MSKPAEGNGPDKQKSVDYIRLCSSSKCVNPGRCLMRPLRQCDTNVSTYWFHLTAFEHICRNCLVNYARSSQYREFQRQWSRFSKTEPSLPLFLLNEVVPFYLQCNRCAKWRDVFYLLEITPADVDGFRCEMVDKSSEDPCGAPEHPFVSCIREVDSSWIEFMRCEPLIRNCVGMNLLKRYDYESMGLYPICRDLYYVSQSFSPFDKSVTENIAVYVRPDFVDEEEKKFIADTMKHERVYLALRNLVIMTFYQCPTERLTVRKVHCHLFCRGLIRIHLMTYVPDLIDFLTGRGLINYGLFPSTYPLSSSSESDSVIIVGGGLAGLVAARHFHVLGIKYTLLEASGRLGGRISDAQDCYKGAQCFDISPNKCNLLVILGKQLDHGNMSLYRIPSDPVIYDVHKKSKVSKAVLHRMAIQFAGILQSALQRSQEPCSDTKLLDTLVECQRSYSEKSGIKFSTTESCVYDILLKVLEISCRTNTLKHSTRHFRPPKSFGEDFYVVGGMERLVTALGRDLNIHLNSGVESVDYTDDLVTVRTKKDTYRASHVLITVPIPILQTGRIKFVPQLPESKLHALRSLGSVFFEKVIMHFRTRFWDYILDVNEQKKFIVIDSSENPTKIPFQVFVDITETIPDKKPTLLTFITNSIKDKIEKENCRVKELCECSSEIVEKCLNALRLVFEDKAEDPDNVYITNWSRDPRFATSGTYLEVGASPKTFDSIAEPLGEKVFFAGEGACRQLPNCALGAALSGLREAARIVQFMS